MATRTRLAGFVKLAPPRTPISYSTPALRSVHGAHHSLQPSRPAAPISTTRRFAVLAGAQEKKYTADHEWIELDPDGTTGTIGISTYAAAALGDVVYVELPTPDTAVSAGDMIGAVESVKSASDIMTPVGGTIIEGNKMLEERPGLINKGPEGEGWIARIRVEQGGGEVEGLMEGEAYRKFTEEVSPDG